MINVHQSEMFLKKCYPDLEITPELIRKCQKMLNATVDNYFSKLVEKQPAGGEG